MSPEEIVAHKKDLAQQGSARRKARIRAQKIGQEGPPLRRTADAKTPEEEIARDERKRERSRRAYHRRKAAKPVKEKPSAEQRAEQSRIKAKARKEKNTEATREYLRKWHQANKERRGLARQARIEEERAKDSDWYRTHLASHIASNARARVRQRADPELAEEVRLRERSYANKYRRAPKYRAYANDTEKRRMKEDKAFRVMKTLRGRIRIALKSVVQKRGDKRPKTSTTRMLGCSLPELMAHIERQFTPGMSWDNWSYTGWHLDHIRPLSSFDLLNPAEVAIAIHYTNLQPLWATENFKKNARTDWQFEDREDDDVVANIINRKYKAA